VPEHILPASIRAELITHRVCTPCNRWAGEEIDQPWLSEVHVKNARQRWQIPDRRGNPAPSVSYPGKLGDGGEALVRIIGEQVNIRRLPSKVDHGDSITLTGYDQKEYEKIVERLRRQYPKLVAPKEITVHNTSLAATVHLESNVHIWPRFAAKVALGIASLLVPDSWLATDVAIGLRQVLRDGHPQTLRAALDQPGIAWSAIPFGLIEGSHPVKPPQHLITFEEVKGEQWLIIVVFGELLYRVPLRLDWGGLPPQSWLFNDTNGMPRQLPAAIQFYCMTKGHA
jgi:hypothetical protein